MLVAESQCNVTLPVEFYWGVYHSWWRIHLIMLLVSRHNGEPEHKIRVQCVNPPYLSMTRDCVLDTLERTFLCL